MSWIKHYITITRHRHLVIKYCFKCGLYKQGLLHDLSKYSCVEFLNGAKYYAGTYSPNHNERLDKGFSEAWMHHKGRNKHHAEYWVDADLKTGIYSPVKMPNRYIAESICDRIAASQNYNRDKFTRQFVLDYFYKEKDRIPMHEETKKKMELLLKLYVTHGEDYIFKYIKENMRNNNV